MISQSLKFVCINECNVNKQSNMIKIGYWLKTTSTLHITSTTKGNTIKRTQTSNWFIDAS